MGGVTDWGGAAPSPPGVWRWPLEPGGGGAGASRGGGWHDGTRGQPLLAAAAVGHSSCTELDSIIITLIYLMKLPQTPSSLIKNHHLGHEGIDVADMREAASCRHRREILPEITEVIGLMIALRK
jgi:hypothetical protein